VPSGNSGIVWLMLRQYAGRSWEASGRGGYG